MTWHQCSNTRLLGFSLLELCINWDKTGPTWKSSPPNYKTWWESWSKKLISLHTFFFSFFFGLDSSQPGPRKLPSHCEEISQFLLGHCYNIVEWIRLLHIHKSPNTRAPYVIAASLSLSLWVRKLYIFFDTIS